MVAMSPRSRPRKSDGWVPNQHGAWAMLVTPWLLGLWWMASREPFEAGWVVLFVFWLTGYFAFFATTQWLKSHRKPRYLRAMATYAVTAGALGVVLLVLEPSWWSWVGVFAPLTGIALWLSWQRRERALLSGLATVAAASLLPLVLGSDGVTRVGQLPGLGVIAAVSFAYFFGTVLYVKTMIRERGEWPWVVASVVWHALAAATALLVPEPFSAGWLAAFFAVMAVRALALPLWGPMRGRTVTPKALGIGEIAATLLLVGAVMLG